MSADPPRGRYETVVFAGGGCRCFWQAGFWSEAAPALGLEPATVATVSAGAALACSIFANRIQEVLADFTERVAANPKNVYPENALRGEPLFPHGRIYRGAILANLDEEGFERLQDGPEILISVGELPPWTGDRSGYLLGLAAFVVDQGRRGTAHARWGRRFGFRSQVLSVRDCETPEALTELILCSSCTPPVTPLYRRNGRAVLDGGIYDHIPVEAAPEEGRTLVLLTKQYPDSWLPKVEGREYVGPSEPIPVAKWDYTSPDLIQRTFDLGRADGERFARDSHRSEAA